MRQCTNFALCVESLLGYTRRTIKRELGAGEGELSGTTGAYGF